MKIEVRVEGEAAERIRDLCGQRLEDARSQLIRDAMIETLQRVIERNPVDTARSRAAWVRSLEELGGTPPAGWEGPHPSQVDAGRRAGKLTVENSKGISIASAMNFVHYVPFLEYGTSRMSPFAMARAGLQQVRSRLQELFRL
ncbi:hypothetical protein SH661x_004003 [Planctomicrobium sp. SH661]|uniref:hypothetical protein n=1 Tax=Planctomicrobium sp. SH661 TaxID=3448124 RepID=UPI003F5BD831